MAALILPRRFSQQPQQPAPLDLSNPLLRGTTGLWSFQNGLDIRDLVTGITGTFSDAAGNYFSATGPAGRGLRSASNTSRQINTGRLASSLGVSGSSNRTIYGVASMDPMADTEAIFTLGVPSSGQDWTLRRNGGTGGWRLNIWGVVSVDFTCEVPENGQVIFICTQNGTTINIWMNGASRANNTGTINTTDANFCIGGGPFWPSWARPIQMVGVANRAWTDNEKRAFSDNPWQVFKAPSRRIWVEPVASNGESPVSADLAASYAITGTVSTDLAASYGVVASVSADLPASYAIVQSVSNDLVASYAVEASTTPVSADLAASYSIASSVSLVSSDLSAAYGIFQLVASDLAASYAVLNGTVAVNVDLACAYSISGSVYRDLAASFAILSVLNYARAPAGGGYAPARRTITRPGSESSSRAAALQRNNR
ncbi:MAG TPA: hypothetical protein VGU61_19900 [Noviherbaspirillum sp.]|jgi:hypothetical protein|uniref:hypothetical protein n=1 Tax=Noviherbaspirillum sp. TaxID=1926288 RepID=UPI002DDD3505|nr:hypothetical protein [Noviherbaspirillum sp.]HEV2612536.1 hypothetical protein [Noviherbaspirillum sp.]